MIDGLKVRHPRTFFLPRVGVHLSAPLYAASLLPHVARMRGRVDVILAPWAYPDGCASVLLGHVIGVPTVVKTHGSDINVLGQMRIPRQVMRSMLPRAAHVVCVSRALAEATADLGVPAERISVVYDGVETSLFRVRDRTDARLELGLPAERRILLYVGFLKRTKGVIDLLEAFSRVVEDLPDATLVLVGEGPDQAECEARAARLNRDVERVIMAGPRLHGEIGTWMAASDLVTLPSWAEGTPTVLLEALACGRRLVASSVGGIPDVITSPVLGEMVEARDIAALAGALRRALSTPYDPQEVARFGTRGDWSDSAADLFRVLQQAVEEYPTGW